VLRDFVKAKDIKNKNSNRIPKKLQRMPSAKT